MAVLTVQSQALAGIVPSYTAAAGGGDSFPCPRPGRTYVHVKNGSGGSITVTMTSPYAARSGSAPANNAVVVAAGAEKKIWVDDPIWVDANGNVNLTYSGVTSLTVGIFQLP
jgi:uncharacterized Zn-binding protein involved in type VI secretion